MMILNRKNLIHLDHQHLTFPEIENDIKEKTAKQTKKTEKQSASFSVIRNSAQKSHDHSKSQSIPARVVQVGDVRDVLIGGSLNSGLKRETSYDVENDDTDYVSSGMQEIDIQPNIRSDYILLDKRRHKSRKEKHFMKNALRLIGSIHSYSNIPALPKENPVDVKIENPHRSALAIDRPYSYPKDRGKKTKCKKLRNKTRRKGKQHSKRKACDVSWSCMCLWNGMPGLRIYLLPSKVTVVTNQLTQAEP